MKNSNNNKNIHALGVVLLFTLLFIVSGNICAENPADSITVDREVISQVSLLQGLTFGDYNGSIPVARLKELGDIGIGTFDALNGELIMLEGVVYRAAYDGSIEIVPDEETIPFSNVTFFDADEEIQLTGIDSVGALKAALDKKVSETGENRFYMIKAEGTFNTMNVRSELPQTKPYKPLAVVLETDQTFFDYENIQGTVVGLYCPAYMNDLNAVGWHFHFVSDDRLYGGHVLDLSAETIEVSIDKTDSFAMVLPDNEMFNTFDLTIDQSEDIKKVETGEGNEPVQQESSDEQEIARKLAKELIEAAAQVEPEITAVLQSLESENARLVGLEHRLKSEDSLTRKILSEAHDMEVSPEEAAAVIGDVLRYTLCIDDDQYVSVVDKTLKAFAEKNITVYKFRNRWGGDGYKGINTNLKTGDGLIFELQLHTPASFDAKELEHANYEVARSETATEEERIAAEAYAKEIYAKVPVPAGAPDYNWEINQDK